MDPEHEARWAEYCNRHRCDSQARGSVYDSKAGLCCHFCRQKKLCGEGGCQRCIRRDPGLPCIGAPPPAALHAREWHQSRSLQADCRAALQAGPEHSMQLIRRGQMLHTWPVRLWIANI